MKVSHREKVILMVLIFLIIVGIGGMTLIKSEFQTWRTTCTDLEKKQAEKDAVDAKIATDADLEAQIKEQYKTAEKAQDFFYDEMMTYAVEQELTPIFVENDIIVTGVQIEEQEAAEAEYYLYDLFSVDYELGTAADLNESRLHAKKGLAEYVVVVTEEPQELVLTEIAYTVGGEEGIVWQELIPALDQISHLDRSIYISEIDDTSVTMRVFSLAEMQEPKLKP